MKSSIKLIAGVLFVLAVAFGSFGLVRAATTPVDLGTAGNFAILAGSKITDLPTSTIIGNVGLSPAAGSFYAGLLPIQVSGTMYDVDGSGPGGTVNNPGLLTTAKNDLTAAYTDAAGRTPVTVVPTELGGTTKTAGIYASNSTALQITAGAGALVLDGRGDPGAVFIFQGADAEAGALTVGPGSTISLINGAQACNVYWRVYGATIDTTAVFKGNLMALTSITVNDRADIEGRLLARNGAVTLINDTIRVAACASSGSTTGSTSGTTTPKSLATTGLGSEWILALSLAGIVTLAIVLEDRYSKNIIKETKEGE
jgi:hypothetical protein